VTQTGVIQLLTPFYEKLKSTKPLRTGQICFVVTPYLYQVPQILDFIDAVSGEKFVVRKRNVRENEFHANQFPKALRHLNFGLTERPLFVKAKKRPVIIISPEEFEMPLLLPFVGHRKHLSWNVLVGIPIYSIETEETRYSGVPQEIAIIASYLRLPQFFYCPPPEVYWPESISGLARLDRLFTFCPHHLTASPTNIALNDDAVSILLCMLQDWLGLTGEEKMKQLFEEIKIELRKEFEENVRPFLRKANGK